jgi:aryl-alcohol dehydrogenase-like predicted oxidoreductase
MRYRELRGLKISEVGVGSYSLSGAYGRKETGKFATMIGRAHELGVNFFDTTHVYGDTERILGEALKPFRDDVIIATKIGMRDRSIANLSREHIKRSCEESLERLKTHYIDLYQVHFDDPATPVEKVVDALEELVDKGKIRRYGLGHLPALKVEAYCEAGDIFSVLMELSPVARVSIRNLLPTCRKYGAGAIAFSTTGRGLLTGKIHRGTKFEEGDIRNVDPLFQRENLASGLRVADGFRELAERYGKTPAQAAIAWVLSHPEVTCALTGASNIPHLEENLGASGWSLTQEDLRSLDAFFEAEDKRLRHEQVVAVKRILSEPLPAENATAFSDLIYLMETAMSLGLAAEEEIVPVFREIWAMRKNLGEDIHSKLVAIQSTLRKIIREES